MSLSEPGWPPETYQLASAVDNRVVELISPLLHRVTVLEVENDALWDVLSGTREIWLALKDMVKKRARDIMLEKLKRGR